MTAPGVKNKKRLVGLLVVLIVLLAVLLVRVGYWSLVESERLQAESRHQLTADEEVAADRGTVFDRNGSVLAQSAKADTVIVQPGKVNDAAYVAKTLASILDMDESEIYEKATDTEKYELWIKRQITPEQSEQIRRAQLTGVEFIDDIKRYYPNGELACQTLGLTTVDGTGQSGIEKQYDKYLYGVAGRLIAETDKKGRELVNGNELFIDSKDGSDIVLSLDSVVQSILEKACSDAYSNTGADSVEGIVLDPGNGQVLAMANIESYDLNDPPRRDSEKMAAIINNACISREYVPGDLFELITMAAAIDSGTVSADETFDCPGYTVVDGKKYLCKAGHKVYSQSLENLLENFCSVSFVNIVDKMGADRFFEYLSAFSIGEKTGIDLPGESKGVMLGKKYVNHSQLISFAYGEEISLTPMQLACAASSILNGGAYYRPYLCLELKHEDGSSESFEPFLRTQPVSSSTSSAVREILSKVAKHDNTSLDVSGYTVGGIGGIMRSFEEGNTSSNCLSGTYIGFAPTDSPQYIVLICIDNPKIEDQFVRKCAAPYVNEVLESVLKYANIPASNVDSEEITLASVEGKSKEDAKDMLEELGFEVEIVGTGDIIVSQQPAAETVVETGSRIVLYTETDEKDDEEDDENLVEVPNVVGKNAADIRNELEDTGLKFEARSSGIAVRQDPAAYSKVEKGTKVTVYFELDL